MCTLQEKSVSRYLDSLGISILAPKLALAVFAFLGKPVLELIPLRHLVHSRFNGSVQQRKTRRIVHHDVGRNSHRVLPCEHIPR